MADTAYNIAQRLTEGERIALLAIPVPDRGNFSDESWWAFYSILDAGLIETKPGPVLVLTSLGQDVLGHIPRQDSL